MAHIRASESRKKVPEIADKEVDESLNYLRERFAEYIPVQRPAENGDLIIADLLKKHDKLGRLQEEKLENVEIELGSKGILEEFQRGLLGMRIGEMKDISVKYPDNYHDPNLAGDQILFLTVVKEIKKKVLPELNDEFATKVSKSQERGRASAEGPRKPRTSGPGRRLQDAAQ